MQAEPANAAKLCGKHNTHASLEMLEEIDDWPAGQAPEHTDAPVLDWYLPAGQPVQTEPEMENLPMTQLVQAPLVMLVSRESLPPGQLKQAGAPVSAE